MPREVFTSDALGPSPGPFSPAVRGGDLIFVSGQVGVDPATAALVAGDTSAQVEQIFRNLRAVLSAAGRTLADVVRVGVYLTDMNDFHKMNAVYEQHFEKPYPARTTIAVAALPLAAKVEMDLVAK